jgi:hypothetical protein
LPPSSSNAGNVRKVPAGDENPVASPVDEQLHDFWKKNSSFLLIVCGLVLLGYLGKEGWEYFAQQREAGVQAEFAAASSPEKYQAFADAHPDHVLTGVADLRLADFSYAAGRMEAAISSYGKAIEILKTGPLAARARLGLAMAKIQSGEKADGEAGLHELADDTAQFKAIRAEATYQLASLAASAGQGAEVQKLLVQLTQIDPNSPWTQRAYSLQAQASKGWAGSSAAAPTGGISFRPAGK